MGFGTEMLFVLGLSLLILGPKRFHTMIGHVARARAKFEEASQSFKSQLTGEPDVALAHSDGVDDSDDIAR